MQELTLDLEKKEPVKELEQEDLESTPPDTGETENDYEPTQDDTEDLIDNSSHIYGGQRATYASLLTQGHLYFRSWNELQAQMFMDPKKFPSQFNSTLLPPLPPPTTSGTVTQIYTMHFKIAKNNV